MTRDPRYDVLFESVQIGPHKTKNRFYQVPHCNGMGSAYPSSMAEMRGIKAEGGWSVVCTEEVEIHHTSEHSPLIEGRLWDDRDIPVFARMAEKIHAHGALAGLQPAYSSFTSANLYSREIPMATVHRPVEQTYPIQARAMDKDDIRNLRRWHVDAAVRAQKAGFDIVYDYCGHDMSIQMHFLSRRHNRRSDEYGGSLENRVRLFREILYDIKDAVGDRCAVAVRFAVDELLGEEGLTCDGEARDVVEMLADLPDLWDVNVSEWSNDSSTSRFSEQNAQSDYTAFVKKVTQKPVVGVGRLTSPDTMVSLIKKGHLDLIGAARPSIADPFLPRKIEEGRLEDIRECIGCNICVTADFLCTPLRCTQNPTMGEEWRRGWHPEKIAAKKSDASLLVVGAGPAGLECARALGQRGYAVTLAEQDNALGGRVTKESRLPGLSEWSRVRDYRQLQLDKMVNVEVYRNSGLSADQVQDFGARHVVLATGSRWRGDGVGRAVLEPVPGHDLPHVLTPDAFLSVEANESDLHLSGPVVIYDDDHYYMGGILAEILRGKGYQVTLVTPAADVSNFTHNTMEQARIQTRLLEKEVSIKPHRMLESIKVGTVELACIYTERVEELACGTLILVTARLPNDDLYYDLLSDQDVWSDAGIESVTRIGDCLAPGTIAAAVYGGHRYARELDEPIPKGVPFRRELPQLAIA
ncbi:MAG: FAD-dependent oxidoreductase [Pseudomonadota bacterium]